MLICKELFFLESAAFQPILAIDMVDRRVPTRFEMDFQYLLGYREDIIPVISQKCFQQLPMNAVTFLPGCNAMCQHLAQGSHNP